MQLSPGPASQEWSVGSPLRSPDALDDHHIAAALTVDRRRVILAAAPWPTWQQAWLATAALVLVRAVLRRRQPTRGSELALPAVQELIVLTGLYGLWRTARKLPFEQADGALDRARSIITLQERFGLPSELVLQEFLERHEWLGWLSAAYYYTLHVPALLVFLVWVFWWHRDHYGRWRNVLALTTLGCLIIRFLRVAPPRFFTDLGFTDLAETHGFSVYGPVGTGVSPQFAAMPSIHVAWAAVVGLGVVAVSSSRWRWLVGLHLPITFLVVAGTGHHWWLDGLVAVALLAAALLIDEATRRWLRRHVEFGSSRWFGVAFAPRPASDQTEPVVPSAP